MAKTYEALERAEREYKQNQLNNDTPVPQKAEITSFRENIEVVEVPGRIPSIKVLEPYEELKAALFSRYQKNSLKSILFNGTSYGDGCSTTALNFAAALAQDSNIKVVLVEVNLRTPSLQNRLKIEQAPELTELVSSFCEMVPRIEIVGSENLYVIAGGCGNLVGPHGLFQSDEFDQFMKIILRNFDYVILDAPPVPVFSEFRILCSKVDGVILVVKSGKTRKQVIFQAKKELESAGGRFLGTILNQREYYIPEWLYKRL